MTDLTTLLEKHNLNEFHPQSKVWVYQSNRALEPEEQASMGVKLQQFTRQWTAHNQALKATGFVAFDRFVVLMVDETQAQASGCSIDTSVRFLKDLEQAYDIQLFDRLNLACQTESGVKAIHKDDLPTALNNGELTEDTIVFNNMVQTKADLENQWMIPFKQSWAASMVL